MYVLVFWIHSKTTSIVEEKNLSPNVDVDNITEVLYSDGEKYEAKILKKSYDKKYLESLYVNTEAEIIKKKKNKTGSAVAMKKPKIKNIEKVQIKIKKEATTKANSKLMLSEGIFDYLNLSPVESSEREERDERDRERREECDREDLENREREEHERKEREERDREDQERRKREEREEYEREEREERERAKIQERERENQQKLEIQKRQERKRENREKRERQEREEREREEREAHEREKREEREREYNEKLKGPNEDRKREDSEEREREDSEEREREERARKEKKQRKKETRERRKREEREQQEREERERYQREENENREREERRQRKRERRIRRENYDNDERFAEDENPLINSRQPGPGKIQLCRVYNVWIDQAEATHLERYFSAPKEMTRKLLKILVGSENLKFMCARGRSKRTQPVPKEILDAVEYYVNKKCTTRLTPAQFTTVVNMMCATLRGYISLIV